MKRGEVLNKILGEGENDSYSHELEKMWDCEIVIKKIERELIYY